MKCNRLTVKAGEETLRLLMSCFDADMPPLLEGWHGVGKSDMFLEAARRLGVNCIVRDLSTMEPPDLIGMPLVGNDGRMRYAPPAFLPRRGAGFLVFEELNRCPHYIRVPCLQLLTSRELNDYHLPPRWLPAAAVNPTEADYHVDQLDPALLSRFLQIHVVADPGQWTQWARTRQIHPAVIAFVEQTPGVFDEPVSNPRSWTYVGRLLKNFEQQGRADSDLLLPGIAGLVGETWALAFLRTYQGAAGPLLAEQIIDQYSEHQPTMQNWIREARLDMVEASLLSLKQHLIVARHFNALIDSEKKLAHVRAFFADLPADLRVQCEAWLDDQGFRKRLIGAK